MNAVNPQPRKNEGARARDLEEKMKASELVATYSAGDQVAWRDKDGVWKAVTISTPPEVMQISGVTKYKFKIDGMKEPVFSETPLRRIEGLELASQLASAGTVEIGQKAYEVGFPKDTLGNIVLGQEGKEEYYLQEVDATGSAVGEKRFISIEILKSIAEATSAQERFSTELVNLESQIGALEGIKTKELYSKLATLQKEVDRISKLVDFSTASAEDTGVKELRKINARIEQLVEKINDAVRELSVDIRRHKTSTDKKTKNKAEVIAEQASEDEMKAVGEEFDEILKAEDWRFEHGSPAAVEHAVKLKKWNDDTEAMRVWNEANRAWVDGGRRGRPPTKPAAPGPKPAPLEKPSLSKTLRADTAYDIISKRPNSDHFKKQVLAEVQRRMDKITGTKASGTRVDLSTLDEKKLQEEVLKIAAEHPQEIKDLQAEEEEIARLSTELEQKKAYNKPLDDRLRVLDAEEQKHVADKAALQQEIAANQSYIDQERNALQNRDAKKTELDTFLIDNKTDLDKLGDLEKERRALHDEKKNAPKKSTSAGKRTKSEIDALIAPIDQEISRIQVLGRQKLSLETELQNLETALTSSIAAADQVRQAVATKQAEIATIESELSSIQVNKDAVAVQKMEIKPGEERALTVRQATAKTARENLIESSAAQERAKRYIGQVAEGIISEWKEGAEKNNDGEEQDEQDKKEEGAFDFKEQTQDITRAFDDLKAKILKVPKKAEQKFLRSALDRIRDSVAALDEDTPDLEKNFLAAWKAATDLEIEIDRNIPIQLAEDEKTAQEVQEARERQVITRELSSEALFDLLIFSKKEMGEVVVSLYEQKLSIGEDSDGQEVIKANAQVTRAVKDIFSDKAPTNPAMIEKLRQYGIRDWQTFKELWDSQYASHVGMMLQENINNEIDGRVAAIKMRHEEMVAEHEDVVAQYKQQHSGLGGLARWVKGKVTRTPAPTPVPVPDLPSDEEIRFKVIEQLEAREIDWQSEIKIPAFDNFTRMIATAMREINMELRLSAATDEERAEILGTLERDEGDYVRRNGHYFVRNDEVRMLRPDDRKKKDDLLYERLPTAESRRERLGEIRQRVKQAENFLGEIRAGHHLTTPEVEDFNALMKDFKEIAVGKSKGEKVVDALLLTYDLRLQDVIKDLIHEYDSINERKSVEDFYRVARSLEATTNDIAAKDAARKGIVATVQRAQQAAAKKGGATKASQSALAAVLLVGGLALGYWGYKVNASVDHKAQVQAAATQADSARQNNGTARVEQNQNQNNVQNNNQAGGGGSGGGGGAASGPATRGEPKVGGGVAEAQIGNAAERTSTTTTVTWDYGRMVQENNPFELGIKKFYPNKTEGEVLLAATTTKDMVGKMTDFEERKAATRGLYILIDATENGSTTEGQKLKSIVDLANTTGADKDKNWKTATQQLAELGKPAATSKPVTPRARPRNT